ncbi:MAG: flagellar export protein FliJ [Pseudomonadota bacterium]
MRDRLSRLLPVQKFAEQQEQDAASELAQIMRAYQEARRTLQELIDYKAGYGKQSATPANWDACRLRDYRAFMDKLDQAISAQRDVVDEFRRHCDASRQQWQDKHQRHESLAQLRQKIAAAADCRAEQLAQKAADDLAQSRSPSRPFER